tara:strand:+ start:688 stop:1113 length:426 start_codon:yes stop_codon:yes gene_type:complete
MKSYWDLLSPDLQSYILQISNINNILDKKKKFIRYLQDKLISSYKFNICYGLFFIDPNKYTFSIKYVKYHINLIIELLLRNKIYSMNQLIQFNEKELNYLLLNKKYYYVLSFWRYYYFMDKYNLNNLKDLELKWLQNININ